MSVYPHPTDGGAGTGRRGVLVSFEGISGIGKSHLTRLVARRLDGPLVVEEFSGRRKRGDLGSRIVSALAEAAGADRFLRGGCPASETLLLLAVQLHTFETIRVPLHTGRTVLEGRSLHSVAVYQAAALHPHNDAAALAQAHALMAEATAWRPAPDLTVLLTDRTGRALARAEQRDGRPIGADERAVHERCARLFEELTAGNPRVRRLDRAAQPDPQTAADLIADWISTARPLPWPDPASEGVPA
ncbi:thymidylate kinase [Streptomyces sp. NPDC058861]|uniref:thymidylate kinase n=1 Tax=Streptomyces sp. NPDC058861 TaxID=3346653 RepID=UPI00367C5325